MKHIILLSVALLVTQTAQAKTNLTYKVFAGGVNAVEATMSVDESKDRYNLFFTAKTRGILGKLAPWSGSFESDGWVKGLGNHQPEKHTSVSVWRSEKETKEYAYRKNGSFNKLTITEDGVDKSPGKIDKKLTNKTIDLLAATMNVMSTSGSTQKCEGSSEVFDGKRRFELMFKPDGTEKLIKSRYNIYDGNTVKCTVEIKPISGKWHEKPRGWLSIQEQGRAKGSLPTIWMGKVAGSDLYVPVKIRVKTEYGTMFMHLKNIATVNENSNSPSK